MKTKLSAAILLLICFAAVAFAATKIRLGTVTLTGNQGNSGIVQNAGTVSGTGAALCTDANGNTTTVGCSAGFSLISTGKNTSVCTTGSAAESACTTVVTISPTQADTLYMQSCIGITRTNFPMMMSVTSKATNSITVEIVNGTASEAQASTYSEIDCIAVHP